MKEVIIPLASTGRKHLNTRGNQLISQYCRQGNIKIILELIRSLTNTKWMWDTNYRGLKCLLRLLMSIRVTTNVSHKILSKDCNCFRTALEG